MGATGWGATRLRTGKTLAAVFILLVQACGGSSGEGSSTETDTVNVQVPAPPPAATLSGSPTEQAAAYSERFATILDDQARLADTLGAFAAAGLVVITPDGSATVPVDGQAGIPWSTVWAGVLVGPPGIGMPLTQLGRTFVALFRQPLDSFMDTLLEDFRTGLSKGEFVASLVAADAARFGVADLSAENTSPEDVYISAPTLYIVATSLVQAILSHLAPQTSSDSGESAIESSGSQPSEALLVNHLSMSRPRNTSPLIGEDCLTGAADGWGQFIGTKVMGGFKTPLGSWDGVISKALGSAASESVEKILGPLNAFLGVLSTIVQYSALTADASAQPLERTRSSQRPGKETDIEVTVSYDYKHSKNANKAFNCIQASLGLFGIGTSLPPSGPVSGADVEFVEKKGFGAGGWVQWWSTNTKMTTNDSGRVSQTVAGQKQAVDIPSSARKIERTYSVDIRVALDPDNDTASNKLLIDSVACAGSIATAPVTGPLGVVLGCTDMILDLIKQINFSLGEREFTGSDWQVGYEVSSTIGYPAVTMKGKSCAKENPERGPWTIEYFVDLPHIGRHSGPPMQFTFVNGRAPFAASFDQGNGYYAWYATGTALLVGDESSGWKIVFTDIRTEFRSVDEAPQDAPSSDYPDLELKPFTNCPP